MQTEAGPSWRLRHQLDRSSVLPREFISVHEQIFERWDIGKTCGYCSREIVVLQEELYQIRIVPREGVRNSAHQSVVVDKESLEILQIANMIRERPHQLIVTDIEEGHGMQLLVGQRDRSSYVIL